ncbi:putative arabinogalactan endo-beta-1,4-galactanase A [Paramyrothecium foliicola]|nr:putative arabinogalactan endo-beta-1,4-galactanase A [Paramyrothecium foliicola]
MFHTWIATVAMAASTACALTYVGADISSLITEEQAGIVYKDQWGVTRPLEQIMAESGINLIRQRVWTTDGDYGIDYNLQLAQRVVNAGWQQINCGRGRFEKACQVLRVLIAADWEQNATIDFVAQGDGLRKQPSCGEPVQTIKRVVIDFLLQTINWKLSTNFIPGGPEWWYDLVLANGLSLDDFDVHAHSMYPYWGADASFSNFGEMAELLRTKYGNKEIQVVETGWPVACPNPEFPFPPDQTDIPINVEGQRIYFERMAATLEAAGASGFNVWEPAWVRSYRLGASCDYSLMFDQAGQAFESLSVFKTLY